MFRLILTALLYASLSLGANAEGLDELRDGDMRKLQVHDSPREMPAMGFETRDGTAHALSDTAGKVRVVNFWATWCAPCRKEMPMLSELQEEFGGDDFEVLTLASGRNIPARIIAFFDEIGVDNLPRHQDPKLAVAREMGVLGLPVTVLINPEGREIGRLIGDAEWNSDSAKAIIAALLADG